MKQTTKDILNKNNYEINKASLIWYLYIDKQLMDKYKPNNLYSGKEFVDYLKNKFTIKELEDILCQHV